MDPITIAELKSETCPRISAEDLIELCELRGPSPSASPVKHSKSGKPKIVVIDVRGQEEYPLQHAFYQGLFLPTENVHFIEHVI